MKRILLTTLLGSTLTLSGLLAPQSVSAAKHYSTIPVSLRGVWVSPTDRQGHQLLIKMTSHRLVNYTYDLGRRHPFPLIISGKKLTVTANANYWFVGEKDKSITYEFKRIHHNGKLALKTWNYYSHGPSHRYFSGYFYRK